MSMIPARCPGCGEPLSPSIVIPDGGCWLCPFCFYSPCSDDDDDNT